MNLIHTRPGWPSAICLDIETYGAYRRTDDGRPLPPQTHMHPVKCVEHDRVGADQLVQLVSVSWRTPDGIESRYVRWALPAERLMLRKFILNASVIEGANLPFDLKMLRYADRYYAMALRPFSKSLLDFSVLNYLHNELRLERSLKSVSRLLNTFNYDYVPDFKRGDRFENPSHPDSLRYVHSDTVATIINNDRLWNDIQKEYPGTDKLTPECLSFYSDLLWTLIMAEESGVSLDKEALESIEAEQFTACEALTNKLRDSYNLPVRGPGSGKAMTAFVNDAVLTLGVENDRRLKRTPSNNSISTGMENLNLLTEIARGKHIDAQLKGLTHEKAKATGLQAVPDPGSTRSVSGGTASGRTSSGIRPTSGVDQPPGVGGSHRGDEGSPEVPQVPEQPSGDSQTADSHPDSTEAGRSGGGTGMASLVEIFDSIQDYRFRWRLISAYTYPILHHQINKPDLPKFRASRLIRGVVYPNWFPVPTTAKDDAGASGGTEQGRVTAKQPALQVLPSEIKKTIRSRWSDGYRVWGDYSQIELRVAALLSGDPTMMREYAEGVDRHIRTAQLVLSVVDPTGSRFHWKSWTKADFKASGEDGKPKHPASDWRQLGKTLNFLITFRGEAHKLRTTAARDMGILLSQDEAQRTIDTTRREYGTFDKFQEELIAAAVKTLFLALPITGQSRSFVGTKDTILSTYIPTIVNFPIQTTAANITLSLWATLQKKVIEGYLEGRIHLPLNIYDSLFADVHASSLDTYLQMLRDTVTMPPYYLALCKRLGRYVPLAFDVKVFHPDGTVTEHTLKGPADVQV